eukprot:1868013-Pyramimonas_sp.AAC.1
MESTSGLTRSDAVHCMTFGCINSCNIVQHFAFMQTSIHNITAGFEQGLNEQRGCETSVTTLCLPGILRGTRGTWCHSYLIHYHLRPYVSMVCY